jgi:glucose/arabinose dehydrogenase
MFHTDVRVRASSLTNLSRTLRGLVFLSSFAILLACSGGDEPAPPPASLPNTEQAQFAASDQYATTAHSLPQPSATIAPTLHSVPPAPVDGLPPRASQSTATKLALADGLGYGVLAPSILRRTIVGGLIAPTDLVFASDGTLFFTERGRGLFALRLGAEAVPIFSPKDLANAGSSGMLAVALDPEFARNRFVYVFMRSVLAGAEDSRVVRVTINASSTQAADRRDILVVPAAMKGDDAPGSEPHAGGALRFGPDGYLYVGLGDERSTLASQSGASLAGKVLRIDRDGQAAPGNAVPAGFDKRVFALGLRDPVALAFHPNTEAALIGQRYNAQPDDIALAKPGANGGWAPQCATPKGGYCEHPAEQARSVVASGLVASWRGGKAGEGLTAIERLRDPMWGDWRNAFVVAFDKAQRLDLVKFDAEGRTLRATPALEKLGVGFKAVAQGPDGLYVVTSGKRGGEEIWRLSPQ